MSNWLHFGHDVQRTSADPDGNITSLTEKWVRYGGTDSKNGWAGAAIADSDSLYYAFSSYFSNIGGTGDRFSMKKFDRDGNLKWTNTALGGHNTRKMWPAKVAGHIMFHDYKFMRVDPFTGATAGGYWAGDSYGTIVTNPSETKMFSSRVASNEGYQGRIWFKAFDPVVFPNLSNNNGLLWTRNAANTGEFVTDDNKFDVAYDNGKIFYAPNYRISSALTTWNFPSGIYCWDENGTEQWRITTTPLQGSSISVGNNRIYLYEGSSLVARNQADGSISWSTAISGSLNLAQPPVLANNLAVISTSTGIYAYNATTGAAVWNTPISGLTFADPNNSGRYTVLAAALLSNTLVATALGGVYILSLTDGSQVQLYNPPAIAAAGTGSYLSSPARPVNPIIVDNRVYITITYDNYSTYFPQALVCLESSGTPPPTDSTSPSTPGDPTFSSVTSNSMTVSWVASTDNVAIGYYNLHFRQLGGNWSSITKTTNSHNFTGLASSTTYEFYVNAVDTSGNISSNSSTTSQATTAIPVDSTPPSTPGDPTFSNVTSSSITVSWTASTDNIAVAYYKLYWRQVGGTWSPIDRTTTSHNFTGLTSGITYEFYVTAIDTSGNSSADSSTTSQATVSVPPPDTTIPSTPGNPSFTDVTTNSMTVSWTASTDNVAVSYYKLYWRKTGDSWDLINKTSLSHNFTGLLDSTTYEFYVVAVDTSNNSSADSAITSQTTLELGLFTQLSGAVSFNISTGRNTIHTLNWTSVNATMTLQRRTGKTSYTTIYAGEPPYSYDQPDFKTNYFYRVLLDGANPSNEVILKSSRNGNKQM